METGSRNDRSTFLCSIATIAAIVAIIWKPALKKNENIIYTETFTRKFILDSQRVIINYIMNTIDSVIQNIKHSFQRD